MRYEDSVFGRLLKPVCRRAFAAVVKRHDGDAYDKSFRSWDHLVALIFAHLSGIDGLRLRRCGMPTRIITITLGAGS